MVKCPFCGYESNLESFKQLREPWKFKFYTAKMLERPRCKGVFNHYEGLLPRGRRSMFTIRVRPRR